MTTAPKRGRGRPQLAEADRRTRLPVLLTSAERAEIDAAAGEAGASTWLRGVGLRAARDDGTTTPPAATREGDDEGRAGA